MSRLSRRDLLKTGLVAGVSSIVPLDSSATTLPVASVAALAAEGAILPLTCSSDVFIPPRGESFFKFSYDFPEPSVAYGGMLFSFRLYTFEMRTASTSPAWSLNKRPAVYSCAARNLCGPAVSRNVPAICSRASAKMTDMWNGPLKRR